MSSDRDNKDSPIAKRTRAKVNDSQQSSSAEEEPKPSTSGLSSRKKARPLKSINYNVDYADQPSDDDYFDSWDEGSPLPEKDSSSSEESVGVNKYLPKKRWCPIPKRPRYLDSEDSNVENIHPKHARVLNSSSVSSSSCDESSESCSICLAKLTTVIKRGNEIARPNKCQHHFCLECLNEWAKTARTCPVDRRPFSQILVVGSVTGRVLRHVDLEDEVIDVEVHEVDDEENEVEEEEDVTCIVCGEMGGNEGLVICMGCVGFFHPECVSPPINEYTGGDWMCKTCDPTIRQRYVYNSLIGPRTRTTANSNGRRTTANSTGARQRARSSSLASSVTSSREPTVRRRARARTTRSRQRRSRRRRETTLYRTVYEIDPTTGETVPVLKRQRRVTRKRRRKTNRSTKRCSGAQSNGGAGGGASGNGIPTLSLFGYGQLDYFTDDEEEDVVSGGGSAHVVTTRRTVVRHEARLARRKAMIVAPPAVVSSTTTDLLDSILNEQERFYSKNATYSVDANGNFKIDIKSKVDVTKEQGNARETPYNNQNRNNYYNNRYNNSNYYYNRRSYNNYNNYNNSNQGYNNQQQQHQNQQHSTPSSSLYNSSNRDDESGGGNGDGGYDDDYPQDYTRRTLCANQDEQEPSPPPNEFQNNEDIDIYGDIETAVTTSRIEPTEGALKPPPTPPEFPNIDDDNDSEPDQMVIDDKMEVPPDNDAAVTSTVGFPPADFSFPPPTFSIPPPPLFPKLEEPHSSSEGVQSTGGRGNLTAYEDEDDDSNDGCPNTNIYSQDSINMMNEGQEQGVQEQEEDEEDNDDNNEGCPNFSIYSRESKTVALHTDLTSAIPIPPMDYQVGEVSSTPNKEEQQVSGGGGGDDDYDPEEETKLSLDEQPNEVVEKVDETISEDVKSDDEEKEGKDNEISDETKEEAITEENVTTEEKEKSPDKNENEEVMTSVDEASKVEEINSTDQVPDSNSESVVPEERNEENDDEIAQKSPALTSKVVVVKPIIKGGITGGLYSDSEDEGVVKKVDKDESFGGFSDINHMTEDISEEERSYTPCLDEKTPREGLEGLDTEMISDDDKNDFDESHEMKTGSEADALEINAKESELEFTRPEDYEEGEIVDKNKGLNKEMDKTDGEVKEKDQVESEVKEKPITSSNIGGEGSSAEKDKKAKVTSKKKDVKGKDDTAKNNNKENETRKQSFKKLSKNNRERNYREKDRSDSRRSREKEKNKERKKERRREIERYNVRAIIAEKPRPLILKDQFGRDLRRTPSGSRSRSYTPPPRRSPSRGRSTSKTRKSRSRTRGSPAPRNRPLSRHQTTPRKRSLSKSRSRKRRRSRRRSLSHSRSRSPIAKVATGAEKNTPVSSAIAKKKRKRSLSNKYKKRPVDRNSDKRKKKRRSRSRNKASRSLSPRVLAWNNDSHREWTPISMSPPPQETLHEAMSPSWTPPRTLDNTQVIRNEHLTVTLNNSNRRKEKRKRDKRNKENSDKRRRRRQQMERERTPPPSKEVFASGDNILVSVSFNNENEVRDVTTRDKRKSDEAKKKKEKRKRKQRDLAGVKPVAIIDLARSPFRELTPSPKAVIVLTDSENDHEASNIQQNIISCDSSQQVVSPERGISNYSTGPKTPPEPQVKFTLTSKVPQVRAISNPLHEADDMDGNEAHDEEIDSRMNENVHKGPNTPPEPPNSPPSSPDAYDPFEPTKSRSPTPEPAQMLEQTSNDDLANSAQSDADKSANVTMEAPKSLTPPLLDVQPADSQSSIQATPETNLIKSPGEKTPQSAINQSIQPVASTKPVAQTTPFSSVPTSLISSTPIANLTPARINILNSTVISAPQTSIPQRIVLPNQIKSSPVKISPTKTAAIKSTPIKPMPATKVKTTSKKRASVNASSSDDFVLDFDSPYSPGSSDYEDLFEPPSDIVTKPVVKGKSQKHAAASAFDSLFGSPTFKPTKTTKEKSGKFKKSAAGGGKTKTVGVKLDEDNLKILDELPNSAVEMLVKDKFLKKLNRQERVVEEVKLVLKPHYNKKRINKEEYKDIMRRTVPKICHNKSGEINPTKIKNLVEAYVRKMRHNKKVTSSSSVNTQKV